MCAHLSNSGVYKVFLFTMAKARQIARTISVDKELNEMSLKSQLIYTWCIPFIDDFGLLTSDVGNIKYLIFPRNPHISEGDIRKFCTEATQNNLLENLGDCFFFKGFSKNNVLTEYRKAKSEFRENRYNKGKSKYSQESPGIPMKIPVKIREDKIREDKIINTTVPDGTALIIISGETMPYEELTYEPLQGSKKKNALGKSTMFVLVRAYLDAKGIVLEKGEQYDANKVGKGLSKLYNECKKDPAETIRRIKLGAEYFGSKELDWTPEAIWRRWEDIKIWGEKQKPIFERRKL